MQEFKKEDLFTIEEVAKFCGLTRNAMYMRYLRGQIDPVRMRTHRLYFTREAIDEFRANYCPFTAVIYD